MEIFKVEVVHFSLSFKARQKNFKDCKVVILLRYVIPDVVEDSQNVFVKLWFKVVETIVEKNIYHLHLILVKINFKVFEANLNFKIVVIF